MYLSKKTKSKNCSCLVRDSEKTSFLDRCDPRSDVGIVEDSCTCAFNRRISCLKFVTNVPGSCQCRGIHLIVGFDVKRLVKEVVGHVGIAERSEFEGFRHKHQSIALFYLILEMYDGMISELYMK